MEEANSVYVTQEGLKKLQEEYDYLINVRRPEVASQIAEAKADGDISENAGYDEAKNAQAFVEGRILTLRNILISAVLINSNGSKEAVNLGCKVTIRDTGVRRRGDLHHHRAHRGGSRPTAASPTARPSAGR